MRIDTILAERRPVFSFEFFPPKTDAGYDNLRATLYSLRQDEPSFVSVTYGAMGTTRDRTIEVVKFIKEELGIEAMAHFTCVGATVDELRATIDEIESAGVENVLALRGDAPQGQDEWVQTEGGLLYSTELIELLGSYPELAVGAASFPEIHPDAESADSDLRFLRAKQDAGASFFITQLFFDNELYFEFVARAREAGVTVPIVPGIMPVTNYGQIKKFTEMCGATIPEPFEAELEARSGDTGALAELGVAYAALQCTELLAGGAPGIH